jgi:hypothetical protein
MYSLLCASYHNQATIKLLPSYYQATTKLLPLADLKPEEGHAIGSELPVGAQNLIGTCSHAVLLVERLALLKVPPKSEGELAHQS